MNWHRFLAYAVLACWIGLTAVTVGTALQWSAARGDSQVKIQRALTAQKEASASPPPSQTQQELADTPAERAEIAARQRDHDHTIYKSEEASDAMASAINMEAIVRNQFWWEFAVWGGLTLLTSALLAERRESEEAASTHRSHANP